MRGEGGRWERGKGRGRETEIEEGRVGRGGGVCVSLLCLITSTFWASNEGLKFDLTTTFTSIFCRPTSRTRGITRNGRLMSLVVRYLEEKTSSELEVSGSSLCKLKLFIHSLASTETNFTSFSVLSFSRCQTTLSLEISTSSSVSSHRFAYSPHHVT